MQGIEVGFPFVRKSANPIDATLTLTKAQMVDTQDSLMPDKYFTVCQDDGAIYLYDKSATASATTGKFKKFEGGGTDSIELTQAQYDALPDDQKNNGTIYFITDGQGGGGGGSYVLPPATASTLGGVKVGSGLSVAVDGTLSATGGGTGDANFEIDEQNNTADVNNNIQYLTMDLNDQDTLTVVASNPGTYFQSRTLATKDYVDAHATEYTAGENIAIDSNNVISANSIYVDKDATTLWTGSANEGSVDVTLSSGTWDDYDVFEFWGAKGNGAGLDYGGSLIGVVDMKGLQTDQQQYIARSSYTMSQSSTTYHSLSIIIRRTGDNTGTIVSSEIISAGWSVRKIVGIKYNNLGAVVGSVTQNGNNVPIVNNTLSFNTPRAISTRVDGEITGMTVVEDGGSLPARIEFNRNIDGVQVIMEDEAERLNTVLVDKDAAQTLTAPNGTKYKLTVANDGTLSAVAI